MNRYQFSVTSRRPGFNPAEERGGTEVPPAKEGLLDTFMNRPGYLYSRTSETVISPLSEPWLGKSLFVPSLSIFVIAALIFGGGCTTLSASGHGPGPETLLTAPLPSWAENRHFQKALRQDPGSSALEAARIDYLLDRISNSPYNFIRNGGRYTGKRTAMHLRWKYFRQKWKIKTAEAFIEKGATRSKLSGESYWMELPDRKRYPVGQLLSHELRLFDLEIARQRQPEAESNTAAEPNTLEKPGTSAS